MFRLLRWHLAKARLAAPVVCPPPGVRVCQSNYLGRAQDWPPNTEPYGKLAALWDDCAGWFVPDYGRFLEAAGRHHGIRIHRALDLACGTGLLSRQIARRAEAVVGLDVSRPMLTQAALNSPGHIRYVEGDFRDFDLGEVFDAAVCGSDSLNSVEAPAELADVFRCVGRHLRPGGIFAFDVLDDLYLRTTTHLQVVIAAQDRQFAMYKFYNPGSRVGEVRVVAGDAIERHRRVPIEEEDVRRAAATADLVVTDYFSSRTYLPLWPSPARRFYVVRKPREGGTTVRQVAVTGTTLAYHDWGRGRPLVSLHGGLGVDAAYLQVPGILGLAGDGRRVLLYDQRGHGASGRSAPVEYTHARWGEDLRELAVALGLDRFALLSHSYGGFLALEFAVRHPQLLTALVLVGTSAGPVPAVPPPVADDTGLREFFRGRWPHFFAVPDKHWEVFERLTFSREPFEAAFRRELPRYDLRERVAGLAVPTLLVAGGEDPYRADLEWLAGRLPRSRLVVLPGVGHLPFLEEPEAFRAAVDRFLREAST
jgi:proline iminopeptidase